MEKKEKNIKNIVSTLNLNGLSKRKVAFSMRNSIDDHTSLVEEVKQTESELKLPKIKARDLGKQIKEMKLRKLQTFTKAYLHDYTVFNYKIDTVLNEAYGFIKNTKV